MEQTNQGSQIERSKSKQIFELAAELLADIELSRLSGESLLLKASRLAKLVGSIPYQQWLQYEMVGYAGEASYPYMGWTCRWVDFETKKGYWHSFPQLEAAIHATDLELRALQLPTDGKQDLNFNIYHFDKKMNGLKSELVRLQGIKSRVMSYLHTFASNTYYEKAFSGLAETIFEKYKMTVDVQLAASCGDILSKLPIIYDRLAEADAEAISQALTTCRRVVDSFADSIFPPTDQTIELGGNTIQLGPQNHKNRINAYISQREQSDSRRQRLRQTLANLYDRICAGVHDEITADEARALFLTTYLFLGEVLTL